MDLRDDQNISLIFFDFYFKGIKFFSGWILWVEKSGAYKNLEDRQRKHYSLNNLYGKLTN